MTYKEIERLYKKRYNKVIKSCWIADVKRKMGLKVRKAYNRKTKNISNKCPEHIIKNLSLIIKMNNK